MKRSIFILASLTILNLTLLKANTIDNIFPSKKEVIKSSVTEAEMKSTLETLSFIPNQELAIKLAEDHKTLVIDLKSQTTEILDWIIYKTGGEIVSRIKTDKSIDEIKVTKLDKGDYVLMIKDAEGRILHQPFTKV